MKYLTVFRDKVAILYITRTPNEVSNSFQGQNCNIVNFKDN